MGHFTSIIFYCFTHFAELCNLQVVLHNLAMVKITVQLRFRDRVRFRSAGICKMRMHDFEIAQHNLQTVQLYKLCATSSLRQTWSNLQVKLCDPCLSAL